VVAADVAPLVLGDTVLERYRTIELIAKGGHSVVFRGRDERLERPVCIKVFTTVPGDAGIAQTSYEHFVQEAFALSRLTHPHTLRIYDFGHLGEATPFHVSEYMNGGTLTTQVKEHGRLDAAETLKVTRAMCDALAEAHSLGIVHRDVKPHNILFAMVGTARLAKLADFGVAKWHEHATASASSSAARAGDTQVVSGQRMAMYSPSWAAPEQLAGQGVSAATDIYSLALVAVYMLTGRAIFADDDLYEGYRKRRRSDELVAEALAAVELPAAARDLLARALRFHPDERPDDATLFGVELAEAFEPITGPAARLPEATGRAPSPVELVPSAEPAPARPSRPPPTRRLTVGAAFEVAKRRGGFAAMTNGQVDVAGLGGTTRVRVTLLPPTGGRRQVHLKGLSSFLGRRAAPVQLDGDAMLDPTAAQRRDRPQGVVWHPGRPPVPTGDESVAVGPTTALTPCWSTSRRRRVRAGLARSIIPRPISVAVDEPKFTSRGSPTHGP
jgi:serine/threonine-protein kinase